MIGAIVVGEPANLRSGQGIKYPEIEGGRGEDLRGNRARAADGRLLGFVAGRGKLRAVFRRIRASGTDHDFRSADLNHCESCFPISDFCACHKHQQRCLRGVGVLSSQDLGWLDSRGGTGYEEREGSVAIAGDTAAAVFCLQQPVCRRLRRGRRTALAEERDDSSPTSTVARAAFPLRLRCQAHSPRRLACGDLCEDRFARGVSTISFAR